MAKVQQSDSSTTQSDLQYDTVNWVSAKKIQTTMGLF